MISYINIYKKADKKEILSSAQIFTNTDHSL